MPARILIAVEGSEGDNRPPLAVGARLAQRGCTVKACVPPDYVSYYSKQGIEAYPMGLMTREFFLTNARRMYDRNLGSFASMYSLFSALLRKQFDTLLAFGADADLILASGFMFAAGSVAEKFRIPLLHTVHAPVYFPSARVPPPNIRYTHLPPLVNSLLWLVFVTSLNVLARKELNGYRQALGLPPLSSIKPYLLQPMVLAMDDELVSLPRRYRALGNRQTGYPQLPAAGEPDRRTEEFIAAGPPPVFIGFGSMLDPVSTHTLALIKQAVHLAGCRALVYAGWLGAASGTKVESCEKILLIGHGNHARIFPRMSAVVHHGGAGTVHSAALAGVPQIGVPHLLDQYYLTDRIHRLGAGPKPIPRQALTAGRLAGALTSALTQASYKKRALDLSAQLHKRDGTQEVADLILKLVGENRRPPV